MKSDKSVTNLDEIIGIESYLKLTPEKIKLI